MKNFVGIYDEEGTVADSIFKVMSTSTGIKNIVKIEEHETKEVRLIHKDRIFLLNNEKGSVKLKNAETAKTEDTKEKKVKPIPPKFDFQKLKNVEGTIFFKESPKNNIKSFCIVSDDNTKWKHFNLYNDSLGKNGKFPEFNEHSKIKEALSGEIGLIEKYLRKKGYEKY